MNTVNIRHRGRTTTIQARNANGSHKTLLSELAEPIPDGIVPIRAAAELMNKEVDWESGNPVGIIGRLLIAFDDINRFFLFQSFDCFFQ